MKKIHRDALAVINLFIGILLAPPAFTQRDCNDLPDAFAPGEKIIYHAVYNWNFIWINAGEIEFGMEKEQIDGVDKYWFRAYGNTYKMYDVFFKIRDSFDVWVDPETMAPEIYQRKTLEGSYKAFHEYRFDREKGKISAYIKKPKSEKRFLMDWPRCSFDLLSTVYNARNIDFSNCRMNDTIPMDIIVDGEIFNLHIRYVGRGIAKDREGNEYACIKFKPLLVEGTMFNEGEHMTVWVTDDKNKLPIVVEAKILIGSVKAVLASYEGLKYPVVSKIK